MKMTIAWTAAGVLLGLGGIRYAIATQDPFAETRTVVVSGQDGVVKTINETPVVATGTAGQVEKAATARTVVTTATPAGQSGAATYNSVFAPFAAYPGTWAVAASSPKDAEADTLLKEFQATTDEASRKQIVEKLAAVVSQQFDERQAARAAELKQLEEQLAKLKATHHKREEQKDRIVKDRINQLLNNADGLGWGSAPEAPGFATIETRGASFPAARAPGLTTTGQQSRYLAPSSANPVGSQPATSSGTAPAVAPTTKP